MCRKYNIKILLGIFIVVAIFVLSPKSVFARDWTYNINEIETLEKIDLDNTNAVIDIENKEIRLPFSTSPNAIDFSPDGSYSYAVLTDNGLKYFMFDGDEIVENTVLRVNTTNPLGFALIQSFPDAAIVAKDGVSVFKFSGSGMTEVPILGVQGLSNTISIATLNKNMYSVLDEDNVKTFGFSGSEMIEIQELAIKGLTDPVALAATKNNEIAVIEKDKIRWFGFTGDNMLEIPALSITNDLTDLKSLAIDNGRITVIDDKEIKTFLYDGSKMSKVTALSVTSGLTKPSAIALRPGSYDLLVVDGKNIDYYAFDGTQMIKNDMLSIVVEDVLTGSGYVSEAVIQSKASSRQADMVRVRANLILPAGTSITWSVTADGANWVKRWRGRGTETGPVTEISHDNGNTWQIIGDISVAGTFSDTKELWADVAPGDSIKWKAELATTDKNETPKITGLLGVAVRWEANSRPKPPPVVVPEEGWYYTTTPTFNWDFVDLDEDDYQTAFQVEIRSQSDDELVYDSGKVTSSETSFTLPTSTLPGVSGPLWQSGTYAFYVQIRTWDAADAESEWSSAGYFKVLAFERPRIAEIVSSPPGQEEPTLDNEGSHIMILSDTNASSLPKVKAGARVTIMLDSVGPILDEPYNVASFPYLNTAAIIDTAERLYSAGYPINRWIMSFYTDAAIKEVPTGTVVKMQTQGIGSEGGTTVFNIPPYADGVVVTEGSIYEDWFVVLEGSD